jgi:hypothetical protein
MVTELSLYESSESVEFSVGEDEGRNEALYVEYRALTKEADVAFRELDECKNRFRTLVQRINVLELLLFSSKEVMFVVGLCGALYMLFMGANADPDLPVLIQ